MMTNKINQLLEELDVDPTKLSDDNRYHTLIDKMKISGIDPLIDVAFQEFILSIFGAKKDNSLYLTLEYTWSYSTWGGHRANIMVESPDNGKTWKVFGRTNA